MRRSGRGYAYAALILGGLISGTMNVMHTLTTPSQIQWFMVALSGLLPVILFIAVELLNRAPWRRTASHTAVRVLGVLPIAGIAAFVSWQHGYAVLRTGGERVYTAAAWPAGIDALMIMGTVALLLTRTRTDAGTERVPLAVRVARIRTTALDVRTAALGTPAVPVPAEPIPYVPVEQGVITDVPDVAVAALTPDVLPERTRKTRSTWDRTEAERLIRDTIKSDREIAALVSTDPANPISHTPIYRLRERIRTELDAR